jgi:hypothetical protein
MARKSILKPEGSAMAGIATIGAVYGIYQLNVGSVAGAHATDANHPALSSSRKKAGYSALVLVGGLTLVTRDANVGILGGATIIAMEINYRHAIMANPITGKMEPQDSGTLNQPVPTDVVPADSQEQYGRAAEYTDATSGYGY